MLFPLKEQISELFNKLEQEKKKEKMMKKKLLKI